VTNNVLTVKNLENLNERQVQAVVEYLEATRKHQELVDRYWPSSQVSSSELLEKTANRVGLTIKK
jgi:TfoX/Sxy family transcriptional regulator of competence genes